MAVFILDSSAVVKRYVHEVGSGWVKNLTSPSSGNLIFVSMVTGAEVVAAISRQRQRGMISPPDAFSFITDFQFDFTNQFRIIPITFAIISEAMTMADQYILKGYDAVQLACALELRQQVAAAGLPFVTLISADAELNVAAMAEGIPVDDPNLHP